MLERTLPHTNALGLALVLLLFAAAFLGRTKNQKNLPPGPKGIPIFGNLFQLSMKAWLDFERMGKEYGPIVYIKAGPQGILVLNSHKAASDLLDRRGGIYSDRPRFIVINILTRGLFMAVARYGDLWRKLRRAGHESMNKTFMSRYYQIQEREALIFTEHMLQDSKEWHKEASRTAASSIISTLYDLPPRQSLDDPLVTKIDAISGFIAYAAYPGNFLVEFFPWMRHLPAAISPWKKLAQKRFVEYSRFFMGLFQDVEKRIAEGDERPSIVGNLIRERVHFGLDDAEAAWLASIMYVAGAETTSSTIAWFILAMIAFPDKQRKCQEELDDVVGRSRMPTFEDMDSLPYVQATLREILRWRPPVPAGFQHVLMEDDWYEGYFIPKGTMCFANIWSLNRNKTVYGPDAEDFNPDRFISEKGELLPSLVDTKDGHVSFGFGPRLCLGRHFANNTLFMNIACLLWAATISPVVDEQAGKPVLPDLTASAEGAVTMRPLPFECVVKPRFAEAAAMVSQTKEMHM